MCRPGSIASRESRRRSSVLVRRLVFVAFFIEVGLLLIVLPWSAFWEQNYFARVSPILHPIFLNHFVRGGVTGLGFVNLVAGVFELMSMFAVGDSPDTPLDGPDAAEADPYAKTPDARVEP
jgi:hypothetical protein